MITIAKFKLIFPSKKQEEVLSKFSFSLTNDLKATDLNLKKLRNLIIEDAVDNDTNLIGSLLYGTMEVGIRKIRLSKGNNKGKREGYRLIALVISIKHMAFVIHIYDKKKKADLTAQEKNHLKTILKSFKESME